MNLTITQNNTGTEIFGNEGSSLAHKLYEIASDLNNTVNFTGSISVPYAYADEVEYLNTNFGPKFNITARDTWIKFYHLEIEDAILSSASLNPGSFGSNFASSGHITQDDADSLTQWGITFTNNTNITQFNEFEKFRNVTQVPYNDCFLGCTNLLSIKLPPRLTYIRGWMFNGCSSLSGVVLPASCTTIDTAGFAGCTSLTSIDLSNVLTIGMQAFYKSGLSGVLSLPSLMLLNDREAFADCIGLTEVSELGHVSSVIWSTFARCSNITKVTLPPTCTSLGNAAFENCYKLSSINLSNILSLGDNVFKNDTSLTGELNLPNLSSWNSWAFANTRISSIISLGSVTKIAERVFCDCVLLTSVTLSSSIKTIDAYGFCNCTNLTSLNVSNITTFEQGALKNTRITSLDLSSAINIGPEAFSDNPALTSVTLSSTCTSIGNLAFADDSNLSSIDLSNVVTIGISSFNGCNNLSSIGNLSNVTSLGDNAFKNTKITSINAPNLTTLGSLVFDGCTSLVNVKLSSLADAGYANNMFRGCTSLTTIDLSGSTITHVGVNFIRGCSSLLKVILPTTITSVGNEWAIDIPRNIYIEGLDNINTTGNANWSLRSPIISNPIKDSFTSNKSLVVLTTIGNMQLHSLYEPLMVSTYIGFLYNNYNFSTLYNGGCGDGPLISTIELLYYKDILSFGSLTFYKLNVTNLVINNINPPTFNPNTDSNLISLSYYQYWGNSIFGTGNDINTKATIGTLWVPDSAVATYQADPLYSSLTIKGINTKTNGVDYDLPRYADYAAWKAAEEAAVAQGGHAPLGLIEAWM